MTKTKLLMAMGAVAAVVFTAPASADVGFTTKYVRGLQDMKMMAMMDADKDHKVSKEEFMKYQEAMFDKMDKNHDGILDRNEWTSQLVWGPKGS